MGFFKNCFWKSAVFSSPVNKQAKQGISYQNNRTALIQNSQLDEIIETMDRIKVLCQSKNSMANNYRNKLIEREVKRKIKREEKNKHKDRSELKQTIRNRISSEVAKFKEVKSELNYKKRVELYEKIFEIFYNCGNNSEKLISVFRSNYVFISKKIFVPDDLSEFYSYITSKYS